MKTWAHTKNSTLISGYTEEGLPYFENRLHGWTDHENVLSKEDVVILNAVIHGEGAEVHLKNMFNCEAAMNDPLIKKKCEEAEELLLQEVNLWLNGTN